jgi:hypothetical protein
VPGATPAGGHDGAWQTSLGGTTAASCAAPPPAAYAGFLSPARDALQGLAVCGVATVEVRSGPLADLAGPWLVTAQVTRLA